MLNISRKQSQKNAMDVFKKQADRMVSGKLKKAILPNHGQTFEPLKDIEKRFKQVSNSGFMKVADEILSRND
jgi:hypothetical protein